MPDLVAGTMGVSQIAACWTKPDRPQHDAPEYPAARQAYIARFPDAAPLFSLGDFSLFLIVPAEARWIRQARTLTPAALARALQGGEE